MARLKPTFSLTVGGLTTNSDSPAGGPRSLDVLRDMDIPADALLIRLADRKGISLGEDVSLELGFDGDNQAVFSGAVAKIRPTLQGLSVFALGKMNGLLNLRLASTYEGQTAGQIVNDLVSQAGLDAGTIDDGPTFPRFAVDHRLSGYAHVRGLADRLGYELYTDVDGALMFHALGDAAGLDAAGGGLLGSLAGAAESAVSALLGGGGGSEGYAFAQHLLAARAGRRASPWGSVLVGGESPMSSQGDSSAHWLTVNDSDFQGQAGSGDPTILLLDQAARSKDLADRFAAGQLAVAQRRANQVSLRVFGRPQVDLGDDISVSDVPEDLLNGSGYIRALRHQFNDRLGFVTDLRVALSGGGS